jgi:hypothetical protein
MVTGKHHLSIVMAHLNQYLVVHQYLIEIVTYDSDVKNFGFSPPRSINRNSKTILRNPLSFLKKAMDWRWLVVRLPCV